MNHETELNKITVDESWELLAHTNLGRLAIALDDGGVDIFPVNFLVVDRIIYFASAPGAKLADLTKRPLVALESDGVHTMSAWSVVVRGKATRLAYDLEIEASGVRALHSLSPDTKWNYVKIEPDTISGRRIETPRRRNARRSRLAGSLQS